MDNRYSLKLERDGQERVTAKTENAQGWPTRWEYRYDKAGRLAGVSRDNAGAELYLYDAQGRRAEDYVPLRGQTDRSFAYGPDNRLLRAGDAGTGLIRTRFAPDSFYFCVAALSWPQAALISAPMERRIVAVMPRSHKYFSKRMTCSRSGAL